MKLPTGRLVRERVVADVGTVLSTALETGLTGYARLEPQDALLLDADGVGVLTFDEGVPVVAYHTGTDEGGPEALTDVAVAGPYRVALYELDAGELSDVHDTDALRVPPALPAERLAGDTTLAEQTRETAPDEESTGDGPSAIEAFLDDEEKIGAIKQRAREQARERADEWGF